MSMHPPRWKLERFSVAELPRQAHDEVAAHLGACGDCHEAVRRIVETREQRLSEVPPAAFVARLRRNGQARRARWFRRSYPALALGVAAAAALVVWLRPDATRLKGPGLTVERLERGAVVPLGTDDRVRAGDALRIVVTTPRPALVAVWFVDVNGRIDRLLDAPLRIPAGRRVLPGSVTMETPCVDGWVVLGRDGHAGGADEAALRQRLAAVTVGRDGPSAWAPPGALVQQLRCE